MVVSLSYFGGLMSTLPTVTVHHSSSGSKLVASLFGGHILSYSYKNQDALFISSRAVLDGSKPIRGGIPIAFPQFAAQGPLPMHGFARTSTWEMRGSGDGYLELSLSSSETTMAQWPHPFNLTLRADFDGPTLRTSLTVENTGDSTFSFEALQHTYLAGGTDCIGEMGEGTLSVSGLAGMAYFAKATQEEGIEVRDEFKPVGEFDRVYRSPPGSGDVVVRGIRGPSFTKVTVSRAGFTKQPQLRVALFVFILIVIESPMRVIAVSPLRLYNSGRERGLR